jgi:hypothetical protein
MIKFIYKKYVNEKDKNGRNIIYYDVPGILLGLALLVLTVFFIHNYLSHTFAFKDTNSMYKNPVYLNQSIANPKMYKP